MMNGTLPFTREATQRGNRDKQRSGATVNVAAWPIGTVEVMLRIVAVLLLFALVASASQRAVRLFASPDRRLVARVIGVGGPGFEERESRIELQTKSGDVLGMRDFRSRDGQHGFSVMHGEWSKGGRWFVFNVTSSGGHQPWRYPTFAFDRVSRKFFRLDDYIGPVTSDFRFVRAGTLALTRMNVGTGKQEEPVVLTLPQVLRLARSRDAAGQLRTMSFIKYQFRFLKPTRQLKTLRYRLGRRLT